MMQRAARRRCNAGYLLAEALIALALAAGASSALLTLHLELRRQGELAALHGTAATLGEARLEQLLGALRADLAPEDGSESWPHPSDGDARLAIEWSVLSGPDTTAALEVTVTRAVDGASPWPLAGIARRGAAADSGWGTLQNGVPPAGGG